MYQCMELDIVCKLIRTILGKQWNQLFNKHLVLVYTLVLTAAATGRDTRRTTPKHDGGPRQDVH